MDVLSKQHHQTPVFAKDTEVIYLPCCDMNAQFDVTVPSSPFLRWNVVFGHVSFVSSFGERCLCVLPANRRVLDKLNGVRSPCVVWVISGTFLKASALLILPIKSTVFLVLKVLSLFC